MVLTPLAVTLPLIATWQISYLNGLFAAIPSIEKVMQTDPAVTKQVSRLLIAEARKKSPDVWVAYTMASKWSTLIGAKDASIDLYRRLPFIVPDGYTPLNLGQVQAQNDRDSDASYDLSNGIRK